MKPEPATAAKIAFLIQGLDAPSTRVRILNLLPHFHDAGFSTAVEVYPSLMEAKFLRWRFKRRVFDFDDSVWLRNRQGDAKPSNKLQRHFGHFMKRLDLAICGNPILEVRVRATCPATRMMIIPSSVPAPDAESPKRANLPLRVGWVGTAINLQDLVAYTTVVRAILNLHETVTRLWRAVPVASFGQMEPSMASHQEIAWQAGAGVHGREQADVRMNPAATKLYCPGSTDYRPSPSVIRWVEAAPDPRANMPAEMH